MLKLSFSGPRNDSSLSCSHPLAAALLSRSDCRGLASQRRESSHFRLVQVAFTLKFENGPNGLRKCHTIAQAAGVGALFPTGDFSP